MVVVAGSGRSGTSTMAGVLRQLGLYVPQPEVVADATNPLGFGEPQWVVDFHNALLSRTRVHASDARPGAWDIVDATVTSVIRDHVDRWLADQFADALAVDVSEIVVKDPRLSWFLPTWIGAAQRAGARACTITMLRPPAEVVASKSTYYGGRMADSNRTAAWVNMMLHTELMTRETSRCFVRYHDLLDDWTTVLYRIGQQLGLHGIENATTDNIRRVHQFVDPGLRRVTTSWEGIQVPASLRELAEETWEQLGALVTPDEGESELVYKRLDELRAAYVDMYEGAELLSMSSVIAARKRKGPPPKAPARTPGRLDRVAWLVPHRVRSKIPSNVRTKARSGLSRLRRGIR